LLKIFLHKFPENILYKNKVKYVEIICCDVDTERMNDRNYAKTFEASENGVMYLY